MTGLNLASQGLSGTIPPGLGRLFGLTTLNLSANQLTELRLAGTGWVGR